MSAMLQQWIVSTSPTHTRASGAPLGLRAHRTS